LSSRTVSATALAPLPEVRAGDDLAALVLAAAPDGLRDGDVLVVAHKVVSKAEGRVRRLPEIAPDQRAQALAAEHDKDPRVVQVVLDETTELVRAERGVLICRTHHGFVCANAGVDASNTPDDETVVLLPRDPDASARALRAALRERTGARLAVVVADSFGRAWRQGTTDVAIGVAGMRPLLDLRGKSDARGYELSSTVIAVADELAGAAELVMGKATGVPAVIVRGYSVPTGAGSAGELVMPPERDLFP